MSVRFLVQLNCNGCTTTAQTTAEVQIVTTPVGGTTHTHRDHELKVTPDLPEGWAGATKTHLCPTCTLQRNR